MYGAESRNRRDERNRRAIAQRRFAGLLKVKSGELAFVVVLVVLLLAAWHFGWLDGRRRGGTLKLVAMGLLPVWLMSEYKLFRTGSYSLRLWTQREIEERSED